MPKITRKVEAIVAAAVAVVSMVLSIMALFNNTPGCGFAWVATVVSITGLLSIYIWFSDSMPGSLGPHAAGIVIVLLIAVFAILQFINRPSEVCWLF